MADNLEPDSISAASDSITLTVNSTSLPARSATMTTPRTTETPSSQQAVPLPPPTASDQQSNGGSSIQQAESSFPAHLGNAAPAGRASSVPPGPSDPVFRFEDAEPTRAMTPPPPSTISDGLAGVSAASPSSAAAAPTSPSFGLPIRAKDPSPSPTTPPGPVPPSTIGPNKAGETLLGQSVDPMTEFTVPRYSAWATRRPVPNIWDFKDNWFREGRSRMGEVPTRDEFPGEWIKLPVEQAHGDVVGIVRGHIYSVKDEIIERDGSGKIVGRFPEGFFSPYVPTESDEEEEKEAEYDSDGVPYVRGMLDTSDEETEEEKEEEEGKEDEEQEKEPEDEELYEEEDEDEELYEQKEDDEMYD